MCRNSLARVSNCSWARPRFLIDDAKLAQKSQPSKRHDPHHKAISAQTPASQGVTAFIPHSSATLSHPDWHASTQTGIHIPQRNPPPTPTTPTGKLSPTGAPAGNKQPLATNSHWGMQWRNNMQWRKQKKKRGRKKQPGIFSHPVPQIFPLIPQKKRNPPQKNT